MSTAPKVLDPRNERATAQPAFCVIGASGDQHPIPAFKFWSREIMKAMDGQSLEDMDGAMTDLLGAAVWNDIAATGVNAIYILEAIKEMAADAKAEADLGESGGSTTSSEASTATESKQNSPVPTA